MGVFCKEVSPDITKNRDPCIMFIAFCHFHFNNRGFWVFCCFNGFCLKGVFCRAPRRTPASKYSIWPWQHQPSGRNDSSPDFFRYSKDIWKLRKSVNVLFLKCSHQRLDSLPVTKKKSIPKSLTQVCFQPFSSLLNTFSKTKKSFLSTIFLRWRRRACRSRAGRWRRCTRRCWRSRG